MFEWQFDEIVQQPPVGRESEERHARATESECDRDESHPKAAFIDDSIEGKREEDDER